MVLPVITGKPEWRIVTPESKAPGVGAVLYRTTAARRIASTILKFFQTVHIPVHPSLRLSPAEVADGSLCG